MLSATAFLIWDQKHWWDTVADYSFGYLAPLFFLYILWQRWPTMRAQFTDIPAPQLTSEDKTLPRVHPFLRMLQPFTRRIELLAFLSALVGILLFGFGALMRTALGPMPEASLLLSLGFGISLLSSVFLIGERTHSGEPFPLDKRLTLTLLFLFPAFIWMVTSPMIEGIERRVSVFLLERVTTIVFTILEILGFALVREGNILHLPKGQVGVAEACSGIRSLTACLFTGLFLGAAFLDRFWQKSLLVILAMALAFTTNILRSFFLTLWAYRYGSQALEDTFFSISVHDLTGYSVLVITSIGLFALLPLFDQFAQLDEDS